MSIHTNALVALLALTGASLCLANDKAPLETLVVTANRHETRLIDAPASISVVTKEELQMINSHDLGDALTAEAGVNLTSVGQTRRGISLRGMPVEHTLYLIDGRRISSSNSVIAHSDFELNWLPSSSIENIEVVRGPMSSLYGSDALGGVVNIITRVPNDEFSGEVNASRTQTQENNGGDVNQTSVHFSGPMVNDQLSYSFSGQFLDRADLPSEDDPSVSIGEARESKSAQAALYWTPSENQRLTFNYSQSNDERERGSASRGGSYVSSDDIERSQFSLSYQSEWQWGNAQVNAYDSSIHRENSRTSGTASRPQEVTDQVVDGHIDFYAGENHLISVGGQAREETLKDIYASTTGKSSASHRSAFLQDEWQVSDALLIVGGVGIDNHESYGNESSPRVYAVYSLSDNWVIKTGYGTGFRAPSLTELSEDFNRLVAGGRFWVEGNPDLEPERSESVELGTEFMGEQWSFTARVFENELENLVQTFCYVDCGIRGLERRLYTNVDEALIRGTELSGSYDINNSLSLSLNYTTLDTEDLGSGEDLEDRPNYTANAVISWQPLDAATLRWRSELVGKQFVGNDEYAPNYTLHHLDLSFNIMERLTLYANIHNLLDENLVEESDLYNLTESGRSFNLGMKMHF